MIRNNSLVKPLLGNRPGLATMRQRKETEEEREHLGPSRRQSSTVVYSVLGCQFEHATKTMYAKDLTSPVWNAKLTETQIFRELSIEIENTLFNYRTLYFNY